MLKTSIKVLFALLLVITTSVYASYKPSNLDTKEAPNKLSYAIEQPSEATQIYETDDLIFYFKDERDVLIIYDKRNQYTWKSGLDIGYSKEIKEALKNKESMGYEPIEDKLNTTYTGIANSLVTVEYYDSSLGIKRLASAAYEGATSSLMTVEGEANHFVLDIAYEEVDIGLKVHLFLSNQGYNIQIYNEEITGEDRNVLAAIMLNPFLGASGGMYQPYDEETGKHGDSVPKELIPGYVFVPDGSGALIRFNDYSVSMKPYRGKIYGDNLAKSTYNSLEGFGLFTPFKSPVMPVYGIAHGDRQAAFVGYATKGDAHMEIVVSPEENTTKYTYAYPRFVYNATYYQVFNKRGEGYFTLYEAPDTFDVSFQYDFLAGSGETGPVADYVGMAQQYRTHLIETGVLKEQVLESTEMPMRIDFVMSDLKKSVIGYEDVVVTTAYQVEEILDLLREKGIHAMNVGLYGWQQGGITGGKPWQTNWLSAIGSKGAFKDLIEYGANEGIDISLAQDYINIHEEQMSLTNKAVKHLNNWYLYRAIYDDVPFDEFYYARPDVAVDWLQEQVEDLLDLEIKSHTIEGISSVLMSNHGRDPITEEEAMALYQESLAEERSHVKLNLDNPNGYLWAYTDRYLQAPVYPTQYLIETDTVPFLQMVLNGTMEVYGPYGNFSFSDQKDILRQIDYNIYPAFVLTYEESYYLSNTNSMDFYSTGYTQYGERIKKVYDAISTGLTPVINAQWIDRLVLQNGVICNLYDNGVVIYINYTEERVTLEGIELEPLSFKVVQ